ncbi:GNAT family N-acetyltransferase [Desulfoscipio gibsoniae]|uniref:N-acetyltransferase domain-containing protein n=1 Tax=Desulfoscipio gibsoniae DSM 7213 TaxID=767817 RepID=R4KTL6_9FIRM|nr:GNAT family N-acetyltransferase [Desulfoscipio gibsoniae]AGL03950.1 hypothetical protein Desgi_4729 [Desulfoscipio gibsoniae DSM 7213]
MEIATKSGEHPQLTKAEMVSGDIEAHCLSNSKKQERTQQETSNTQDIIVRFINPGDFYACNNFHNNLYKKDRTDTQWQWEFLHSGLPEIPFVVAAKDEEILGTLAQIPIRMIDQEGEFLTGKSEEALLDPAIRGKGIYPQMFKKIFDYMESQNILVVWGFTPAIKANVKAGFEEHTGIAQLFFPFHADAINVLLKNNRSSKIKVKGIKILCSLAGVFSSISLCSTGLRINNSLAQNICLKTLSTPPEEGADLCRTFVRQWGGTTILRNASFLKWRIFENPHIRATVRAAYLDNQLLGWVAYSLDDNSVGHIVDIIAASNKINSSSMETVVAVLLKDAVVGLRKTGALGVRAWKVNSHPFDDLVARAARKVGFYFIPRGEWMVLHYLQGSAARPSLKSIDNWYINRIYTEGVLG